jgi:hypothetical protein
LLLAGGDKIRACAKSYPHVLYINIRLSFARLFLSVWLNEYSE